VSEQDTIYAYVCPEEGQGIVSWGDSVEEQRPLVFMRLKNAEKLKPVIKDRFNGLGRKVELREFKLSKILDVICEK
jgi:hypothetical protein